VPADRLSRLKQRLQKGADAFEFSALLEGVSTLDAENRSAKQSTPAEQPAVPSASAPEPEQTEQTQDDLKLTSDRPKTRRTTIPKAGETQTVRPITPSRMRGALENLCTRLLQEMGAMRKALEAGDTEAAGYALAQTNEVLELLYTLDPTGDLARQNELPAAPPIGRTWPLSCWSMVELAESPLSALLPHNADLEMVREMLYAAWGVQNPPRK
jgi:hypothetical protein